MTAADLVREAFAVGWATSTAAHPVPLTERARRACDAAVAIAEDSAQPIEPTLKLGQLEGIWAVIYARREAVEKLHLAALGDVLKSIGDLDWEHIVDRARVYLLADPNMGGKALARLVARDVEDMIGGQLSPDANRAWRAAMTSALTDATAQGQTAALALVGDAAGISIDWNLAATAAINALQGSMVITDMASGWIEKQVHGLGYQMSQLIARMWADGAEPSGIRDAIADLLDVSKSVAATLLDTAIGQAISAGALTTYAVAGVQYADYLTAGDERVCPDCGYAEDNNSYLLENCPQPPLHVKCRCCVAPSAYQPTAAALTLLDTYRDTTFDDGEDELEDAA